MSDKYGIGNPAEGLEGMSLPDGWQVVQIVKRKPPDTGGHFSVGYIVEKDGSKGYLKALDLTAAFEAPDFTKELEALTSAFNFERDLLYKCKGSHLSKIVTPIAHGQVGIPGSPPYMNVFYIIFDLADGNIRNHLEKQRKFDLAWILRCLHNASVGLEQLHKLGIAHQDVKPSNVLVYKEKLAKIGDLGRASDRDIPSDNDLFLVPGDKTYAPLERFYPSMASREFGHRLSTDLFLLGSLVYFFFFKMSAQQVIWIALNEKNLVQNLTRSDFASDLPYIQDAFNDSLVFLESEVNRYSHTLTQDLIPLVKMLCEPDPGRRGHTSNVLTGVNKYSLERFISRFDLLAKRAEYGLL